MGVDVLVGDDGWEIGAASFFHAFFSTISASLEPAGWGSRFPTLMNLLYQVRLPAAHVRQAREELADIRAELESLPPSAVVWDIEDRSQRPPWGDDISLAITNLVDYFVTSDGKNLFEVLTQAMAKAERSGEDMLIQ